MILLLVVPGPGTLVGGADVPCSPSASVWPSIPALRTQRRVGLGR